MSDVNQLEVVTKESTLSLFMKALTEQYSGDHKEAGLTMAWITEKDEWYAAVNRFPTAGLSHQRVCFAYGETLEEAVRKVMKIWRRKVGIDVEDNLKKFSEVQL